MSRPDLVEGEAQRAPGCRWKRCLYRDNGDGTAEVLIGRDLEVRQGKWQFIGKTHTLPIGCVRPRKGRRSA